MMAHENRTPQPAVRSSPQNSPKAQQAQPGNYPASPLLLQRAYVDPSSLTPSDVKLLQRTIGNRAVGGLLSSATGRQARQKLSPVGEQVTHETGRAAQQVAQPNTPASSISRLQRAPLPRTKQSVALQRQEADEEAVGNDIFFRRVGHDPGSSDARQPLAHEAPHSVQQDTTKLTQRAPQISQRALASVIQRRTAYVGVPHAAVFDYDDTDNKAGYNRVGTLELNTQVDAADAPAYASPESDAPQYTKLRQPIDGVIKEENLRQKEKNRSGAWDVVSSGSQVFGQGASIYDLRAGSIDRGPLREKDSHGYLVDKPGNTTTQDWQEKHGADVVSGGYETVANILSIAATLRNWKKRNSEERFSDVIDVTKSVASTGAAVTKMVDSGAKMNVNQAGGIGDTVTVSGGGSSSVTEREGSFQTTASDLAGKVTGNIADFVGLIADVKDLFFKGKKLFETWKKHREDKTASKGDVVRAGVDLGITVVSAIKDVVTTARNLLFTLENAWHGGLAAAVPGLGIAIGALKLLVSIWKVVKANTQRAKMRKLKKQWKEQLRNEGAFDATEEIDHGKIADKKKSILRGLQQAQQQGVNPAGLRKKLALIEEYELQKELQTVNRKRIDRQVIHISSSLMSIAGDIATLSGVGAHAGVALKAASAATELGAQGLRTVKQFGNDRAAKEDAWKITKKVFNADKSSKAKLAQREKFADMIYDKVIALAERAPQFQGGVIPYDDQEFKLIRMYIRAVGLSWKAWMNQTIADPSDGHMAIVSGLAERE